MSNAVQQLAPGLWMIDLMFGGVPGVIAAFLLADGQGHDTDLTLIETGPASTLDTLWAGIEGAGFDPRRIRTILVTHIHLDHSGAAGHLVGRIPEARVLVHDAGARHLIDPARLLASAALIYGDRMESLWGTTVPVPEQRVRILADGEVVEVSGHTLHALYTAGHARHHIAYHEPSTRAIFTGDVAGIRRQGSGYIRPPTPPPDLDIEVWDRSIERLRAVAPEVLYLTHFGRSDGADDHLVRLHERLHAWRDLIETAFGEGATVDAVAAMLADREDPLVRAGSADPDAIKAYALAGNYLMSVAGFQRYFAKRAQ